ncbi:hypothetical protein MKX01_029488, partial [Papaver californicum]
HNPFITKIPLRGSSTAQLYDPRKHPLPFRRNHSRKIENSLHLNVASSYMKMGECKKSIEACDKVLEASPGHVKALYRRGMAYMSAGDFEEARSVFKKSYLVINLILLKVLNGMVLVSFFSISGLLVLSLR